MIGRFARALGVAALLVSGYAAGAGAQGTQEFKIGIVLPLTGPGADIAKNLAAGSQAMIPLINARGGIGGMPARAIICDSQSQEQQAILCDRRLISEDKIAILIGNSSTPQTVAALPLVDAAGIPFFSTGAGTQTFRPVKKWVFKALNSNEDMIDAAFEHVKRKNWKRIALIHDNGPFGSDIRQLIKEQAAKQGGVEIVADEVYAPTDTDMTAQVTRVRATRPDVIIDIAATAPPGALVAKKVAQLGIAAPIMVGTNLQTDGFVSLVGDVTDQIVFLGLKVLLPNLPKTDPLYENVVAFRQEFAKANPGVTLNSLSPNTGDAMLVTQAAAKSLGAKALDHNALLEQLNRVTNVPGLQGVWSFTPTSHETPLRGITAFKYTKNSWVPAD
jgi:branched-chain amino acid transport system substrate-binding protein